MGVCARGVMLGLRAASAVLVFGFGGIVHAQCTDPATDCPVGYNIIDQRLGGGGTIVGTNGNDCIFGSPNNDTVLAFQGDDYVCAGAGNDVLYGYGGNDTMYGEAGVDSIYGSIGDDILEGGDDNDYCFGGDGNDTIRGGNGNDNIRGEGDDDMLFGDAGSDTINTGDGTNTVDGGADGDSITGGTGDDNISGGAGADNITENGGTNVINGDGGNDVIVGSTGVDTINGGDGNDTIYGMGGNDILNGDADADFILGGDGDDTIDGGTGDDDLRGEADNDTVSGGDGNDFISLSTGDDVGRGEGGVDDIFGGDGSDFLIGGADNDSIRGEGGVDYLNGEGGSNVLNGGAGSTDNCLNGPSFFNCEFSSFASIQSVDGVVDGTGGVVFSWKTVAEAGAVSFEVARLGDDNRQIVIGSVPSLMAPGGGTYRIRDSSADSGDRLSYIITESDVSGAESTYGPFEVMPRRGDAVTMASQANPMARVVPQQDPKSATVRLLSGERVEQAHVWVAVTGLQRVSAEAVSNALGVSLPEAQRILASGGFSISDNQGNPVPSFVENGVMFFYGVGSESPFAARRAYRLEQTSNAVMASLDVSPKSSTVLDRSPTTVHVERDEVPLLAVGPDPDSDYWAMASAAWTTSAPIRSGVVEFDLAGTDGRAGSLTLRLIGTTNWSKKDTHHVSLDLNGTVIGDVSFRGTEPRVFDVSVGAGVLQDGNNTLTLTGIAQASVRSSGVFVDSVDVRYVRNHVVSGGSLVLNPVVSGTVVVDGVAPGSLFFNVSNLEKAKSLAGVVTQPGASSTVQASFHGTAGETYAVVAPSDVLEPTIEPDYSSDLRGGRGGEYIIVAPRAFADAAIELASYRSSRGMDVSIAFLQDIYDEFNHSMPSPRAIRSFLEYAHNELKVAPRYVVLLGAGSYDYRNLLGANDNFVPVWMTPTVSGLFASDVGFVDFDDDLVPDISVGRIPGRSSSELMGVIHKIRAYESGPSDSWSDRALFVSDFPDSRLSEDFSDMTDSSLLFIPESLQADVVRGSDLGFDDVRTSVIDSLSSGVGAVFYNGHGSSQGLGDDPSVAGTTPFLSSKDVGDRADDVAPALYTTVTCLSGRFELAGYESLAESLVNLPRGGAIAAVAPSGVSINPDVQPLLGKVLMSLYQGPFQRMGDVFQQAMAQYSELEDLEAREDTLKVYNLLGDPALELQTIKDTSGTSRAIRSLSGSASREGAASALTVGPGSSASAGGTAGNVGPCSISSRNGSHMLWQLAMLLGAAAVFRGRRGGRRYRSSVDS